ncbi:hypothetical protein K8R62_00455 [bacterium]|nr:hypothetical protein [bacterium]
MFQFDNKKGKILLLSLFVLTTIFFLSGCVIRDAQISISEKLKWFNDMLGDEFNDFNKRQEDSVINVFKEKKEEDSEKKLESSQLGDEDKKKIDNWLLENGLNKYGDTEGVYYPEGTPLMNGEDEEKIERYQYLLKRYPNILK